MPSIFKKFFGLLICMFCIFLSRLYIFEFTRGVIVVFQMLMVAPVAISYFLKKFSISAIDSSVVTKRLVSSAYWERFKFSFWLGMGYPTIFLFTLMFRFITSPFIMYNRRDKGYPSLTGASPHKFLWGGYVPLILDNTQTLVNVLQKQTS